MAHGKGRDGRVYTIRESLDDEIGIEIKKMESDLAYYADGDITADEFIKRIRDSEGWIMHFVYMQSSLLARLDVGENDA